MKTLYLDCGMGAAGDMLTAALLELLSAPASRSPSTAKRRGARLTLTVIRTNIPTVIITEIWTEYAIS